MTRFTKLPKKFDQNFECKEKQWVSNLIPVIAVRSSVGVELWHADSANKTYTIHEKFARDESKFCRAIEFSPDGRYLAWANGTK